MNGRYIPFLTPLIGLFLLSSGPVHAQEYYAFSYFMENWRDSVKAIGLPYRDQAASFKIGFHASVGLMKPEAINQYIQDDLNRRGMYLVEGTSDMDLGVLVGAQLHYVITPGLQACGIVDYARGISSIEINSQNQYIMYIAQRFSGGAGISCYFGKKTINPYLSGAILFHFIEFEGYEGYTFAPRFEGGAAINLTEKFILEGFVQLNTPVSTGEKSGQELELDFRSASAGIRLMFRILKSLI